MKRKLNVPFFEIGIKNYAYGDDVLALAKIADAMAIQYDVDIILITPYVDIRRVCEHTQRLIVFAPYMDTLRPGRGMADVLPEAIKAAGAQGVVMNHCERPMSLSAIKQTIERANELDLLSFACADSIAEAQAIAQLHPDIINPEPTELIGTGKTSGMDFVLQSTSAIKCIYDDILVEQAAGISSGAQVYENIYAGADAVGASSGILKAPNPHAMIEEMVSNLKRAAQDRKLK